MYTPESDSDSEEESPPEHPPPHQNPHEVFEDLISEENSDTASTSSELNAIADHFERAPSQEPTNSSDPERPQLLFHQPSVGSADYHYEVGVWATSMN